MTLAAELALVAAALAARRGTGARSAFEEQLAVMRAAGLAQAALRVGELVPDFALPDSLATFGIPPGTRLGVRNLVLQGTPSHWLVDGDFGE